MLIASKLDLVLKELYSYQEDNEFHSLIEIILRAQISLNTYDQLENIARKLHRAGFSELKDLEGDFKARITYKGVIFCEENSYAYPGYPIITHKNN